jgi:ABC-type multidrug transport system ATPase subunit
MSPSHNLTSDPSFKLIWRNVSYTVQGPTFLGLLDGHPKQLVSRSYGEFRCGQLSALMGPSGCGKSTLLGCLTAQRRQGVSGEIVLTGKSQVESTSNSISISKAQPKLRSAFIPQFDVLPDGLTARECLLFATKLKQIHPKYVEALAESVPPIATIGVEAINVTDSSTLPVPPKTSSIARNSFLFPRVRRHSLQQQSRSKQQKLLQERLVDSLLSELQLKHVGHCVVDKLSGGQRRRLSIGQELTGAPNILFLDEPTTGLDSSAAHAVVRLLRDCAHGKCRSLKAFSDQPSHVNQKMMIVVIIHQPSETTLELFDWLHLLGQQAKGLYAGKPANLLSYLRNLDLPCPPDRQPIESLMDMAYGNSNPQAIATLQHHFIVPKTSSSSGSVLIPVRTAFRKHPPPLTLQIFVLLQRHWLKMLRSKFALGTRIIYFILTALLIGTIFPNDSVKETNCPEFDSAIGFLSGNSYKPESNCGQHHGPAYEHSSDNIDSSEMYLKHLNSYDGEQVQSRTRARTNQISRMGFSLITLLLGAMLPLLVSFPSEFSLLQREHTNGDCSIGSMLIAKWMSELPLQTFCPILFTFIADVWLAGLLNFDTSFVQHSNQTGNAFSFGEVENLELWRVSALCSVYLLSSWIAFIQATCIGAWVAPSLTSSLLAGPISLLPLLLFSGVFVRTKIMPSILQVFANFSYLRNSFQLMIHSVYGFDRCANLELKKFNHGPSQDLLKCDLGHLRSLAKGLAELLDVLQQAPVFKATAGKRF